MPRNVTGIKSSQSMKVITSGNFSALTTAIRASHA